jgi:hypothetical protein
MRLDWYDREILTFVLDQDQRSDPSEEASFSRFGIAPRRVMRRFDAVVEVFTRHQFALEEPDLKLVQRAARLHHVG